MKMALVLTTINVPLVLSLYRCCDFDVHFYIVGDHKTPDAEVVKFLEDVPNHSYYGYDRQAKLGYKCHDLIGPNSLSRRNIGFLESLKAGADVIVSIDDDNIPMDRKYFSDHQILFDKFDGVQVEGKDGWFDPGQYLRPPVVHRGFPIQRKHKPTYKPLTHAKLGVSAGLVLMDSDIDAYTRIASAPDPQQVSLLMEAGCVVGGSTWTIWNSQNTAVIRELIPSWFMMPNVGRHDDIYASLIVQRVMRERRCYVHFGKPFVVQQRNEHDLISDLRAEISGMKNVINLADLLDHIVLKGRSVIEDTRIIYETLCHCSFIPEASARAGLAYIDDCEGLGL